MITRPELTEGTTRRKIRKAKVREKEEEERVYEWNGIESNHKKRREREITGSYINARRVDGDRSGKRRGRKDIREEGEALTATRRQRPKKRATKKRREAR